VIKEHDRVSKKLSAAVSDSLVNSKSFDDISTKLYNFTNGKYGPHYIFHINVGLKGFTDLNTVDRDYIVASVCDIIVKIESNEKNNTHNAFDIKLL